MAESVIYQDISAMYFHKPKVSANTVHERNILPYYTLKHGMMYLFYT